MARIHVYTVSSNEREMMPLFMAHYRDFIGAQRIVVHCDACTDDTERVARELGAETVRHDRERDVGGEAPMNDSHLRDLRSTVWHASRGQADWIIVVDTDELVIHPRMHELLDAAPPEVAVLQPQGWDLVSDSFPSPGKQAWQAARRGVQNAEYNKPCVFRPDINMFLSIGTHDARPTREGEPLPIHEAPQLKLLHCSFLGLDFVLRRQANRRRRPMSELNVQMQWSTHWRDTDDVMREKWEQANRDSVTIPDLPPA